MYFSRTEVTLLKVHSKVLHHSHCLTLNASKIGINGQFLEDYMRRYHVTSEKINSNFMRHPH